MNRYLHIAAAAVMLSLSCASTSTLAQGDAAPGAAPDTSAVRRVLMPADMADDNLASGCWVRLFDGINYGGDSLTLVGPLDLATMKDTGEPWRDWDSVIVGPRARVTTYDAENFRSPAVMLEPRRRVKDLTRETGRFDDIRSVQVKCVQG